VKGAIDGTGEGKQKIMNRGIIKRVSHSSSTQVPGGGNPGGRRRKAFEMEVFAERRTREFILPRKETMPFTYAETLYLFGICLERGKKLSRSWEGLENAESHAGNCFKWVRAGHLRVWEAQRN